MEEHYCNNNTHHIPSSHPLFLLMLLNSLLVGGCLVDESNKHMPFSCGDLVVSCPGWRVHNREP